MNIFYICLLLAVNFVTTVVAYYRECYDEFSVCLITNTDNPWRGSKFRLSRASADDWCKSKSSSLAIITNVTVQSAIEAFINDSSAKLNSDVITNGSRYNLVNWVWISWRTAANNTHSEDGYHRYGYLQVSAGRNATKIHGSVPTTARNFICSRRTGYSNCPNDHHQLGSSCYKIHNNVAASWFEARNLCLREGYDLATFEYIDISSNSGPLPDGEYWIGLRSEMWYWLIGQTIMEIKYSSWNRYNPFDAVGDCLCLTARTGKWKNCDCSGIYRYICIQGYTPASSTAPASTTTLLTTVTTVTTEIDSTSAPTTPITTSTTQTDGHSTLITVVDDSYKHPDDSRMFIVIGLGIVCLLILIAAIAVVVHIKMRRSSHDPGPRCDAPSKTTVTNADAPNTVYAEIMPSARESTRSPSERTPNQIVYAELDLIPKGNKDGKALQELEYANSIQLNSVYANCAHTRV